MLLKPSCTLCGRFPQAAGAMKIRPACSPSVPEVRAPAATKACLHHSTPTYFRSSGLTASHTSAWPWKIAQCKGVRFQRSSQSVPAFPADSPFPAYASATVCTLTRRRLSVMLGLSQDCPLLRQHGALCSGYLCPANAKPCKA